MLALVSGRGGLPARVAAEQAVPPLVCALAGFEPDGLKPDVTFRLEHLGSLLATLKERGVTEVCLCGAIQRPPFDPKALDVATLPMVPVMMQAMGAGDDGALRAVMALFEQHGFVVRAAHELAPDILVSEGVLSGGVPDAETLNDIARADAILAALSPLDVGQGCVVGGGQVWGIETTGGTDHMLRSLPEAVRAARAVLVKVPKSGQDMRADVPTVGPDTIEALVAAGLHGLVVEAGRVILMEPDRTLARAKADGLLFWARPAD
ncbi:MAG: UDP-2,3-diacylglucosamine diphosphatase LpxI [Roseobacter sp.]|jgi:DUF1009 family protein|nr:UDP-2,3-diacylglucosamine diphosphatase LpxI [Roseobacter sp.]